MNNVLKILLLNLFVTSCISNAVEKKPHENIRENSEPAVTEKKHNNEADDAVEAVDSYKYKMYVDSDKTGKEIISGDSKEIQYFTTYLGEIKFKNPSDNMHVIKQFFTVQAANSKHGHSELMFLDHQLKIKKTYDMEMPDRLPYKIQNNSLLFKLDDKKYEVKIEKNLPLEMIFE